jgi:simple sugar transport system permease protein
VTPALEISRRDDVPRWLGYGAPVVTILAALLVGAIPLVLIESDPLTVYREMFVGSVTDLGTVDDVLVRSVPLFLAALAVYVPLKAGLWNIAVEGQIYLGGIAALWIGVTFAAPTYVLLPAMAIGAAVVGALSGMVPAYLRIKYDLNEIIVTLMITFAAVEFNTYVVRGPLESAGGVPVSKSLPTAARIPPLGETGVHLGVLVLVVGAVGTYYLIQRSATGYEISMVGSGPKAVAASPISKTRLFYLTMALGGGIACVAGMIQIAGVRGNLVPHWSPQYGFIAIPIALLGINSAFRVLGASLFFAVLFVGGNSISVTSDVPFSIVNILIALIFLFLITSEFFKRFRVTLTPSGRAGGVADD